ncbi:hypothetical protein QR680_007111 [Steinernema hermaphroditum]|uniref:RNA polymerase II-associated protein 3 n=1 Tax=Steinernema hermaphroditum TaxID=289476 RepID=A0AA39LY89_9BILA|nr:hypothetical protein QR680_007111 [Steinernema hermaphroditum]
MSADELRTRGNDFFKKSMFHNAIDSYTKSLELSVSALTLANRAQAHLKLAHFESAYADADAAVANDEVYAKGRYRRAMAALKLGLVERARRDCEKLLKDDPKNKEFLKLADEIKSAKRVSRVQLHHVNKCEMIRSNTPLMEIAIEQNEFLPEEPKPETSEKKYELPPPATTASQFLVDYDAMKTRDPEYFGKYLLSLDAKRIPDITGAFLEGDMLSAIIRGLQSVQSKVPSEDLAERLVAVSMSPQFEVAVMFLEESEKRDLEAMFRLFEKEKEDFLRQRYL